MFTRHVMLRSRCSAQIRQLRQSSSLADLEASLRKTLVSRRIPILHDYLTPQPSYMLSKSIQDFLPGHSSVTTPPTHLPSVLHPRPLAPAHHLAYFPTPTSANELLPDGTDTRHSPGQPFNRRLWAGGRMRFPPEGGPLLDCGRAVCVEGIRDVRVTGKEGEEKVFVGIERRVARVEEDEEDHEIRARVWTEHAEEQGDAALIERRDLVFLRDNPETNPVDVSTSAPRRQPLRTPSTEPDFTHTLIPNHPLLFRYSALMFNAHAIHLDPEYTRNLESQPKLLVPGPLLITLMLTCLRHYIASATASSTISAPLNTHTVRDIIYRNLLPVYADEPMTICLKQKVARPSPARPPSEQVEGGEEVQKLPQGRDWDIWIQGPDSGLRVKGTARTAPIDSPDKEGWLTTGLPDLSPLSPIPDIVGMAFDPRTYTH